MLKFDSRVRLHLFVEPCDMRRQMDSLLGMVGHTMAQQAVAGQLYIFMNRRRNYVRLLFLDSTGICLFSKRLFKGTVGSRWALGLSLDAQIREVSVAVLTELLSGSREPRD